MSTFDPYFNAIYVDLRRQELLADADRERLVRQATGTRRSRSGRHPGPRSATLCPAEG